MWWAALAQAGAEALKGDDASGVLGQPSGPITQSAGGWQVNFGKRALDLKELSPLVLGAAILVAGVVAIVAVRAFAR